MGDFAKGLGQVMAELDKDSLAEQFFLLLILVNWARAFFSSNNVVTKGGRIGLLDAILLDRDGGMENVAVLQKVLRGSQHLAWLRMSLDSIGGRQLRQGVKLPKVLEALRGVERLEIFFYYYQKEMVLVRTKIISVVPSNSSVVTRSTVFVLF